MAPDYRLEPQMDYRLSSLTTDTDEAANAPEVDGTVLAPEWRGDNTAPEVAPGHAMQVVVDDSPPEAMDVESSERPSDPLSSDAIIGPTSRKKRIILGLVVMGTMLAALGIGLGLGLPRHRRGGPDDVANTTGSDQGGKKLPHSLIDDTAIGAITCSNGNRQVFFQEESGRLRRALYSSQAGVWQTSTGSQIAPQPWGNETLEAKNATPLATAVRRNFEDDNDVVSLLYIDFADGTLSCLDWELNRVAQCPLDLPKIAIAPDSRQVSAIWLLSNNTPRSLLLIFQDPSQKLVVLQGIQSRDVYANAPWTWLNQTDRFKSALVQSHKYDADLIDSCIAGSMRDTVYLGKAFYLNCFWNENDNPSSHAVVQFSFDVDNRTADITIDNSSTFIAQLTHLIPNSESNLMSMQFSMSIGWAANRIWFEYPVPSSPTVYDRPSPNASFPFQRLSTTSPVNTTKTYLYHQIDDKTLGEEYWDSTSGFWLSSNISIDVA